MSPARMPDRLDPQLAGVSRSPPEGSEWLHEIKLDGYRLLCRFRGGAARFFTRNGHDWTERLGALSRIRLAAREAWLDGELVVRRGDGKTDFQALQNDLGEGRHDRLTYFVFDLLWLDGEDLRGEAQAERKARLAALLEASPPNPRVLFSDHIRGQGGRVFERACALGLEGTISKDEEATYAAGRGRSWLKNRCWGKEEALVGGYTRSARGREGLGALLLGARDGRELKYIGRVGTGFTERTLRRLRERLRPHEMSESPFSEEVPTKGSSIQWVEPLIVVAIGFAGWTREGRLRHPSFDGVREDVEPRTVTIGKLRGQPAPASTLQAEAERLLSRIRLTNTDRVVLEGGVTKGELARHYATAAKLILPHLERRLLTLVRCPKGFGDCFYQKHVQEGMPRSIRSMVPPDRHGSPRPLVVDAEGVLALVQMGVVEMHPVSWRIDRADRPDRLIFDLDPADDVPWEVTVETAFAVRALLERAGLTAFARTTGGKGIHVVVPMTRRSGWVEVRAFCKAVAVALAEESPRSVTAGQAKAKRGGKVYIDWLRNTRGATAVSNYVVRCRPRAPVATPVAWDELGRTSPDGFDVRNIRGRMETIPDPWGGFHSLRQSLGRRAWSAVGLPSSGPRPP